MPETVYIAAMDRLRRLGNQWALGFAALLLFALSAVAFALLTTVIAIGVAEIAALLMEAVGVTWASAPQTAADGARFFWWSAVIWLPVSVGVILPDIARIFAGRIREIEESKRKAELAPYMGKHKLAEKPE